MGMPEATVADFVPVRTDWPTPEEVFADFARGINAIHTCVHEGQDAQAARDAVADGKRDSVAKDVNIVKDAVGELDARQDIAEGKLSTLAKMFGAEDVKPGDKRVAPKVTISWPTIFKAAGTVGGAMGLFIFLFQAIAKVWPVFVDYVMGLSPS